MATVISSANLPPTLPYQPMRVSVERYHQMIAQGFFAENDRFELLEGVIVEKMTKHPPHSFATQKCYALLIKMLPAAWHVISQEPVTLARSEPEPDVAIIKGTLEDFASRHPGRGEIPLVIEVAESSLVTDRYKAGIYAEAGIPVYWIVNLPERMVEVYSSPSLTGSNWSYAEQRLFRGEDEIPVELAGQIIGHLRVEELIP